LGLRYRPLKVFKIYNIISDIFQSHKDGDQKENWENIKKVVKLTKKIASKRLKGEVTYANFMWQEYILDLEDMVRKIGNSANFLQGGVQSNDASVI
jgi:hypothetical protein